MEKRDEKGAKVHRRKWEWKRIRLNRRVIWKKKVQVDSESTKRKKVEENWRSGSWSLVDWFAYLSKASFCSSEARLQSAIYQTTNPFLASAAVPAFSLWLFRDYFMFVMNKQGSRNMARGKILVKLQLGAF